MADERCVTCNNKGEYHSLATDCMVICDCEYGEALIDGRQARHNNIHGDYDVRDEPAYRHPIFGAMDCDYDHETGEWSYM